MRVAMGCDQVSPARTLVHCVQQPDSKLMQLKLPADTYNGLGAAT